LPLLRQFADDERSDGGAGVHDVDAVWCLVRRVIKPEDS